MLSPQAGERPAPDDSDEELWKLFDDQSIKLTSDQPSEDLDRPAPEPARSSRSSPGNDSFLSTRKPTRRRLIVEEDEDEYANKSF